MEIGRQKANFRLKIIDLENGKSKTFSLHTQDYNLESLTKKILKILREE